MKKLVLIISALATTFAQSLISPCPSIFQYDAGGVVDDRWYGTITLNVDQDLTGVWLSLIFDRSFLELGTDFGEAVSRGTNKFLIRRPGFKVSTGEALKIRIFAHFDAAQGVPQVLGLRLNARVICPTDGIIPEPGSSIPSPCPNLFTYDSFDPQGSEWSGVIKVKTTEELNGVWMRVVLDKPPIQFATSFGEAVQREPSEYLVKYPGFKVNAGETITYRINASFIPGEMPPKLLGFRLNGRYVCPESGMLGPVAPETPKINIISPCPNLFKYEPIDQNANEWVGSIKVKTERDLSGIWMRIVLDKPPIKFSSSFGEAVQREPNEFLVKNPAHSLKIGESLEYKINASFIPGEIPPKLVEFRLNAITVCPEPASSSAAATTQAPDPVRKPLPTTALAPSKDLFQTPCPNVFNYELQNIQSNRWYGNVHYKSDEDYNSGVQIQIVLDNEGVQLGNWFSEVNTDDNIVFLITRPKYRLANGQSLKLRFFIKFDSSEPLPTLKDILINEKSICQAEQSSDWVTFAPISAEAERPIFGPDFNPISRPNFQLPGGECGVVATRPLALIINGLETEEAKWPWHAALYYQANGSNREYYCGGNLISLKHILTVAHCTTIKHTVQPLEPHEVHVDLGKYHFSKTGRGSQQRDVENIFVHPEYNPTYYPNDISILLLSKAADLTDWVRPICLWSSPETNDVYNTIEGTVVGWGYNNEGRVTDRLLKAVMPIVAQDKCLSSKEEFFSKFLNDRSFCAGFRNGTSVCIGDSGGGLVFQKTSPNSKSQRWQIRGLVSISVATQAIINYYPDLCDTSNYVIFTDVAKHLDWIHQIMNIK